MFGIAGISLVGLSVYLSDKQDKHTKIPKILDYKKLKLAGMQELLLSKKDDK